ncbi:hypothetical protein MKX03_018907 [Papaver bracteatum]|nr:hypothetical protein MKX03_018907 [Papaver bracteatum]
MLFVTSSFVGWLIGHILFMKWVGLVLFWIRKNNSIRSNKYLVSELRNSMARIFSILLFITCVYYLGRIPSPIVTKKLKEETAETEERGKSEGETDVEIETISETKGTKQEEGSIEEDPSPSLCSEENSKLEILKLKEDKDLLWFEKPLVTLIFDYKRWNRPVRYIKNDKFEDAVRDEMSHYFFFTCESDGKERISFTYPPSLSIFLEMIKGKILLSTTEKPSSEELYNNWNINNAFLNRIDALERGSLKLDVLEKRIRLCNDETEQDCLPEGYDPFLNGTRRGSEKKKAFSEEDWIWINKFHNILPTNYQELEEKKEKFEGKYFLTEEGKLNSENRTKYLFDAVTPDRHYQRIIKESIGIKEIRKEVPQWSYKLITSLEQQDGTILEETAEDHEIRSRKANHVVIFTDTERTNCPTLFTRIGFSSRYNQRIYARSKTNINPNDTSCNDKKLEAPKNFWRIFQRISARLIRKRHSFLNFLIEKIYMDTLLYLINIPRINAQFSLDLKKGDIDKKSYNDEIKKEEVEERKKKRIHFISTKKRALSNISNKNLHHFLINKYHMRSVLQGTQGILNSESRHKKLSNFETNEWKNWLNSHYNYQYNFSKITSSQLALQKPRNGVNQSNTISNKASTKLDSYKQKNLFHYKKQNAYVMDSLSSKKKCFKKQYGYDLLSQKYINYREGKDSYISLSPLQVKGSRKIPYNYNTNKPPIFYMPACIYMSHYLGEDCIVDTDKNPDRKYFDWRIVSFCLRNKIDIEAWSNMDTETRMDKNTKTGINYYSIINQIDTKDLSYLAIDKQIKPSKILNRPISNLHLWFFPELLGLYDTCRIKPWIIPTKSLLFHFNGNQTTKNQEEKEESDQEDIGSDLSNQEKEVNEDDSDSYMKKSRNQNKWKSTTEAELDFFLKRYFLFQLRWHSSLDQRIINSIQIYCLLLRLNNPKQIAISSIQRGEMRLDLLLIQKDLNLTELINKGVLIIEPVRLSIQGDGLFIMYQTIVISLVHKSNHQTNRKNQQKENDYKNSFDESIKRHRHERVLEKRDEKNYAFVVPENILAPRCRRELKIQICLNLEKINFLDRKKKFYNKNNIKNCGTFLEESKHLDKDPKNLDRDRNKLMKLKFFLWPNYRLEDLACMNRYWFDTSNGSRFSMSRIYMYPRFTIN